MMRIQAQRDKKPLTIQRLAGTPLSVLNVLGSGNGRHDWIRTSDLFRVKEAL